MYTGRSANGCGGRDGWVTPFQSRYPEFKLRLSWIFVLYSCCPVLFSLFEVWSRNTLLRLFCLSWYAIPSIQSVFSLGQRPIQQDGPFAMRDLSLYYERFISRFWLFKFHFEIKLRRHAFPQYYPFRIPSEKNSSQSFRKLPSPLAKMQRWRRVSPSGTTRLGLVLRSSVINTQASLWSSFIL